MVDRETVQKRLDALQHYLAKLESLRAVSREAFVADEAIHDLAEHYLHLTVEILADMGNHIIAERGLATPSSYAEIFRTLQSAGVIEKSLSSRLEGWAGFRNVLVHQYLAVDHERAYKALQDELDDLREFAWAIATLL